MQKQRLDKILVERGLCESREKALRLILEGAVWEGEKRLEKAGTLFPLDIPLEIRSQIPKYVSRGGEKLEFALRHFQYDPKGDVCLDLGASTGGFTDCLLQFGAKKVFAVDVGYGQIDPKIRSHPQVVVLEKTHTKDLNPELLSMPVDTLVADLSFISLSNVIPGLVQNFPSLSTWILLFKPQFEVGRKWIGKGGRVRDFAQTVLRLEAFQEELLGLGFRGLQTVESPVLGKKSGNREWLIFAKRSSSLSSS